MSVSLISCILQCLELSQLRPSFFLHGKAITDASLAFRIKLRQHQDGQLQGIRQVLPRSFTYIDGDGELVLIPCQLSELRITEKYDAL